MCVTSCNSHLLFGCLRLTLADSAGHFHGFRYKQAVQRSQKPISRFKVGRGKIACVETTELLLCQSCPRLHSDAIRYYITKQPHKASPMTT